MISLKKSALAVSLASVVLVSGCTTSSTSSAPVTTATSDVSTAEINRRTRELDQRERELNARIAEANAAASSASSNVSVNGDLLPPNAQPGECYARVWVDAEYKNVSEQVLVSEESQKINIIPAQYETVTETVLVSAASSRIETIPAVYGTETETVKVRDGERIWRVALEKNSAPANAALLNTAKAHGIDLASATPGMCFHEHYLPATYKTVTESVLTRAETEEVSIIPARYEMVEETVLVREASTRLENVPAEYGYEEERVIDKPAHTIWKKGTGPIQRIDEATGEIMCLVEVPATYKTIKRRVLVSPATTRTVEIPAEYKTVKVRKLAESAREVRTPVAAVYNDVDRKVLDQDARFVWHEVSNTDYPASTRTGNKICLTETAPQYKTVTRTVVKTPAQSREIEIPAQYDQVQVTKLVKAASEQVEVIPAEYRSVTRRELVRDGFMDWRSILCETNMTRARISDIQRALISEGHNVGPNGADGVIGSDTIRAINEFQAANNLPVDKYINIETLKKLGVSAH